jgi:AcrR family transcriptional regulator
VSGRSSRTQAERRAASEEKLLAAAAELIVEKGIQRTSLAEIGRRAGYSHGIVNHLFGSKAALVARLGEVADEHFGERAREAIGARAGFDALAATVRMYIELVGGPDTIGRVHIVLLAEALAHSPDLRDTRVERDRILRQSLAALIASGVEDGSIRGSVDPDAASLLVVGMLRGTVMQLLLDPDCADVVDVVASIEDLLAAMLRA